MVSYISLSILLYTNPLCTIQTHARLGVFMDRGMYKESCNGRSPSKSITLSNSIPRHYHSPNTSTVRHIQLFTMHITTLILSTGLTLALAPAAVIAWAQAPDGTWVASNTWYAHVGNCKSATGTSFSPLEI
jgi:hypothetical protein